MAEQLGERVGETVGYRVRGDSQVSANTRIEVVTQGILTRILQDDPTLDGIAGLIFDEFHERSLDADLGLALALDVQQGLRPDLRILVMSATLDTDALLRTLGETTPIIDCPGQSWPVTTAYRPAPTNNNRHDNAASHQTAVIREALSAQDGDVLVFLPGQAEIRRLQRQLDNLAPDIDVHALHGQLPLAEQQQVLRGSLRNRRRVILSTAIAESSVTVPGVRIVVVRADPAGHPNRQSRQRRPASGPGRQAGTGPVLSLMVSGAGADLPSGSRNAAERPVISGV